MGFVNARMLAIDPGDEHVGLAEFAYNSRDFTGRCASVMQTTPDVALDGLAEDIIAGTYQAIVLERWLLRPDLSAEQAGSEMETSQMIGVVKWLVRVHNLHARAHAEADPPNSGKTLTCRQPGGTCVDGRAVRLVQLGLQLPAIQEVALGHLRAAKVKSVAKQQKAGPHCLSAELHGWYWLNTNAARMARADQVDPRKRTR